MTINIFQALRVSQFPASVLFTVLGVAGVTVSPVLAQQSLALESTQASVPINSQGAIAGGPSQNSNTGVDQPENEEQLRPPASVAPGTTPVPASPPASPPKPGQSSAASSSKSIAKPVAAQPNGSEASITKKAAGVLLGAAVGMPVAVVRRTAIEDRDGVKGLVGDSDNKLAKGLAGTFWMPFSIVLGVLEGPLYGPGNSIRNVNRPFTKEQMGMGDHLTSLLENESSSTATPNPPIPSYVPAR